MIPPTAPGERPCGVTSAGAALAVGLVLGVEVGPATGVLLCERCLR